MVSSSTWPALTTVTTSTWTPSCIKKLSRSILDTTTVFRRQPTKRHKHCWIKLPYLGHFSHGLGKILKTYHLTPAYYHINPLKSSFGSNKDPVQRSLKSGVYMLPCDNCDAVYIGETGRPFTTRLHEHLDSKASSSAFSKHLLEQRHSYKQGSAALLHMEEYRPTRLALESLESARIRSCGFNVLNYSCPRKGLIDKLYPLPSDWFLYFCFLPF